MKPRESNRKLVYHCPKCDVDEDAGPDRVVVYKRELEHASAGKLAYIPSDVHTDPTLARQKGEVTCSSCGHDEAAHFMAPTADTDDRLRLIFVCTACGHKW